MISEIKEILESHISGNIIHKHQSGLFIIMADAGQGKTFVSDYLAQQFGVAKIYTNEPDVEIVDDKFTTWQQVKELVEASSNNVIVIDSMSIMDALPTTLVRDMFIDSDSGARTEGISPTYVNTLVDVSQLATTMRKALWVTLSLADFKKENYDIIFSRFKGYSNGVLWSKDRKITCTFRGESDRDVPKETNLQDLFEYTTETRVVSTVTKEESEEPTFKFETLELD